MENSAILTADILDLIFEGKNKSYGAYELRRYYAKRLKIALMLIMSGLLLFLGLYYFAPSGTTDTINAFVPPDTHLIDVKPPKEIIPVEPIPPPEHKPIETIRSTTPVIVDDKDVSKDDMPPDLEELSEAKIGLDNIKGIKDDIVAPPLVEESKGIIEAPAKKNRDDSIFVKVEIESSYPGGAQAWERFLRKNLALSQEVIDNQVTGTVLVQFIVDREGNVSNVQAVSGPEELKDAAEKAIRKSGRWNPAIQNGDKVKSYKTQPIQVRWEDQ